MQDERRPAVDMQDDEVLAGNGRHGDGCAGGGTLAGEQDGMLDGAADPGDERDGRAAARERDFVALAAWHEKRDGRSGPAGYRCHSLAYPRRLSRSSTLRLTMNSMKTSIRPIDA